MPKTKAPSPTMISESIRTEGSEAIMDDAPMASDLQARKRRARYEAAPLVRFDTLAIGDVFSIDRWNDVVEIEVTGEPVDVKDRFGRDMKNLPCKRLDTGEEGFYMYGPDGKTRKVTP
jgi:predicted RNA-binding protein